MRETVFLNTDREMPLLGLGVYKTADNEAETAITAVVLDVEVGKAAIARATVLLTLLPLTKTKKV